MSTGYVILHVTPEVMADADPGALAAYTERQLADWCADNGAVRLEGPPKWRPESIDPPYIVASALIWPAEFPDGEALT